jgi:hypothetical protein
MSDFSIKDVMEYKEKTIPGGWYHARILGADRQISKRTGITGYSIRTELVDYNGDIDTEKFNDPIGYKLRTTVWHPDSEKQTKNGAEACARALRKFIMALELGDQDVADDGFLDVTNLTGLEMKVKVKLVAEDPDEYKELKKEGRAADYEGDFFPEIDFGGFKKL